MRKLIPTMLLCLCTLMYSHAQEANYEFDVNILGMSKDRVGLESITNTRVEVYNNTRNEEVLVLENQKDPNFKVNFENGNHYTILVRKEGYFNKRMEAYVNVEGCLLCFDGVGNVRPDMSASMTDGNQSGALLADIRIDPIEMNKSFKIENIYYDLNKWNIRPDAAVELDKVITVMKDNPAIIMELGSHTDARGNDEYNRNLSENRAKEAVKYIIQKGGINPERILAKGYGETQLFNQCANGVNCSKQAHQENRRTELKIVGVLKMDTYSDHSLATIIQAERLGNDLYQSEEAIGTSGH